MTQGDGSRLMSIINKGEQYFKGVLAGYLGRTLYVAL